MKTILINESRQAYKQWFNTFTPDERTELQALGVVCRAELKFFKQEILDIYSHLNNRKLKQNKILYKKFIDRYIKLVPATIHPHINRAILEEDRHYQAWFFSRQMFVFNYLIAKHRIDSGEHTVFTHLLWTPTIDALTPESCYGLKNKVFKMAEEDFKKCALGHWSRPQKGCRCGLISITEKQAEKYLHP